MPALNPLLRGNSAAIRSFFALFSPIPLLFISLSPLPSHSFCHRFISPSLFRARPQRVPLTTNEQYKASRGLSARLTREREREIAVISRARRFVSKCARKLDTKYSVSHSLEIFVRFYSIFPPSLFVLNKLYF